MNRKRKTTTKKINKKGYYNKKARIPRPLLKYGNIMNTNNSKPEIKTVDVEMPSTNIDATGAAFLLNGLQEGTSFYNRLGRKVCGKSLRIIGQIGQSSFETNKNPEYFRIIVVYDRQINGAFPPVSAILLNYRSNGTSATSAFSQLNMDNVDRFIILRDKKYAVCNNNSTDGMEQVSASAIDYKGDYNIDEYIKLGKLDTNYKGSSGAVGDISTGGLLIYLLGTEEAERNGYIFRGSCRYRFYDN